MCEKGKGNKIGFWTNVISEFEEKKGKKERERERERDRRRKR